MARKFAPPGDGQLSRHARTGIGTQVRGLTGGPEATSRRRQVAVIHRVRGWLVWWVLLMTLWIVVDDSFEIDELLAGAAAAALAALLAELASYGTAAPGLPAGWLRTVVRLPFEVTRDTWIVFRVLARALIRRQVPASAFRRLPVAYGPETAKGRVRRAFLIGISSFAPNTFALGIDPGRDVMVVHQLDREAAGDG